MIIIYNILLFMLGVTLLEILNFFKIIDFKKIHSLEYISISFLSGTLLFTIYMFIIGFLNINFSFNMFFPVFLNAFIILPFLIKKMIKTDFKQLVENLKKLKYNKLELALNSIIIILIILFITEALSNYLIFPDEFSHWGIQAKNIFETGKMNSFTPTYNEVYPNFLPLLYSGFYFFTGAVSENYIRIFQSMFLISMIFSLLSFSKKRNLDTKILKMLIILFLLYYPVVSDISSSSYADIAYMAYSSFSIIYLIDWIFKRESNNYFVFSIIMLVGMLWIKRDGFYLLIYYYFFITMIAIFNKILKIEKIKINKIIKYIVLSFPLIIFWKYYTIINNFPKGFNKFDINLDYFIPMSQAINLQLFSNFFTIIIFVILFYIVIFKFFDFKFNEKNYLACLFSFVLINIVFLVFCYLTIFGGEGPIAASFIRYNTRIVPVIIIIILESLKFSKNKKNIEMEKIYEK